MAKDNEVVLTPMMKQYFDLKAKHPDAIMLFRCGDFYETYSEDAVAAAEILGITLTKRANGQSKTVVSVTGTSLIVRSFSRTEKGTIAIIAIALFFHSVIGISYSSTGIALKNSSNV